jgi:acyl transferase domain-containing protein
MVPRPVPIAIVGMGCRFPGRVSHPDALWQLLASGTDAVSELPEGRFPKESRPAELLSARGGFLEDVDGFDAAFFGISPKQAAQMRPEQKLLLEVAHDAMEDAGWVPGRAGNAGVGVFIGLLAQSPPPSSSAEADIHSEVGHAPAAAAGRISYALGLEGPSVVVSTDRSSSLVAVHLACQSLRSGESDLAIAGGANVITHLRTTLAFQKAGMLASDGRCKFGDARADGFVRSEGVGLVVLKPLPRAIESGDRVYAVILGTATNHGGRRGGDLLTPSAQAQAALVERAIAASGLRPEDIEYVEAHGTGTPVGDQTELRALGQALSPGRKADARFWVGSIKTNLGHLEAAAGVAGLIKAALALRRGQIPASLHFDSPTPAVAWPELPLVIPTQLIPWPSGATPRRAGVSSFGLYGTNAHVVLEQATAPPPSARTDDRPTHLLAISARGDRALSEQAAHYAEHLAAHPDLSVGDVCQDAGAGRIHYEHRLAIVATARDRLISDLHEAARGASPTLSARGRLASLSTRPRVAFLFPGQGSQYPGMARALRRTQPVFREALERCARALDSEMEVPILEVLDRPEGRDHPLTQTQNAQPAIFAVAYALAELWRSWGVHPDFVAGQSQGEIAAACVAGALSLEDAARVVCRRSRLVLRLGGQGVMAAVGLPEEEAQARIAPYGDRLSVAVINGPSGTVLSGEPDAMSEVLSRLETEGVFCRRVSVDYASHSPQVEPLRPQLVEALSGIRPRSSGVAIYSTVTGGRLDGTSMDAQYWALNLRRPVQLSKVVSALLAEGCRNFVELSAHPALATALTSLLDDWPDAAWVASLRKDADDWETLLLSAAQLHVRGVSLNWAALDAPHAHLRVPLPHYPFQRTRHAVAAVVDGGGAAAEARSPVIELGRDTPPAERRAQVEHFLREHAARLLGIESSSIDDTVPLTRLGLDSLLALQLRQQIEKRLEIRLPPSVVLRYPTIGGLARLLVEDWLSSPGGREQVG